jgi:hypothetical protein
VMVASVDSLAASGMQLGLGEPVLRRGVKPVSHRPETERLIANLWAATAQPDLVESPLGSTKLLESAARALVDFDTPPGAAYRRLDRRKIVSDCLEFVEASGSFQRSMSEMCRAANTSASCGRILTMRQSRGSRPRPWRTRSQRVSTARNHHRRHSDVVDRLDRIRRAAERPR